MGRSTTMESTRGYGRPGLRTIAAALAAVAIAACGATDPFRVLVRGTLDAAVDSVAVSPATAVATEIGEEIEFVAVPLDELGQEVSATVTWRSTDLTVATIDRFGVATALAAGETRIRAIAGSVTGEAVLTVIPDLNPGPS